MKTVGINKQWKCREESISLPFDALKDAARNFDAPYGGLNSYYDAAMVRLENSVPVKNYHRAYLETSGVCGKADVYADGRYVDSITHPGRSLLPLGRNVGKIAYEITAVNSGRYTGCGIADGVTVHYAGSPLFIAPYGLAVKARAGEKAQLNVLVELVNETDAVQKAVLTIEVYSRRGRRLTRRNKTVRIAADSARIFSVKAAFARFEPWKDGAGVYTLKATVTAGEFVDEAQTPFGITAAYAPADARKLAYDNGILGAAAYPTAEKRKLSIIQNAGYDAAVTPFPREATLKAADAAGVKLVACLFETLRRPDAFGQPYFDRDRDEIIIYGVKALRNHPCVAAYALPDDPDGELLDELESEMRYFDDKPVVRLKNPGYYFDYLGSAAENAARPRRFCTAGCFDAVGTLKPGAVPKDGARMVVTLPDGRQQSSWNLPCDVGQPVTVEVYTKGEVVSLLLDGKQIGRKLAGKANGYKATFRVEYRPGTLEAVCLHRGFEQARLRLSTVSAPRAVKVTPQTPYADLSADGLAFFAIEIVDGAGQTVESADRAVTVTVSGGELVALGTGDPYSTEPVGHTVTVYGGRALAVVRAEEVGRVAVKAACEGLRTGRASVKSK